MLTLIDCISVSYLSPMLYRFGYTTGRIGLVMTLAALASTLARPFWGMLNDRFACAKQVTLGASAVGIGCYLVMVYAQGRFAPTVAAAMGLYVTAVCMMNFVDSWALRLISGGSGLNYSLTRAGGSFTYAIGAVIFGMVIAQYGFRPGGIVLAILLVPLTAVTLSLPNPQPAQAERRVTLKKCLRSLSGNAPYRTMLAAFFLCTLATSATESFYSI